jgi:tetratricopeptide (TPR) repeat protein
MQRLSRKQEEKTYPQERLDARKLLAIPIIAGLLILVIALQNGISNERKAIGLDENGIKSSASTAFELLGGVRTTVAAFLWIKVDRIHDDFYGDFSKEKELMPMYRLVTWLNPHIDEAYYIGSYMLLKYNKIKEAQKFNDEGIKMNPNSGRLELNKAQFEVSLHEDYKKAVPHLERAVLLSESMNGDENLVAMQLLKTSYAKLNMHDKAEEIDAIIKEFRAMPDNEGTSHEEHEHEHEHEHSIWN